MYTEFSLQFNYNDKVLINNILQHHHISICLNILSVQEQSNVFTTVTAERGKKVSWSPGESNLLKILRKDVMSWKVRT